MHNKDDLRYSIMHSMLYCDIENTRERGKEHVTGQAIKCGCMYICM